MGKPTKLPSSSPPPLPPLRKTSVPASPLEIIVQAAIAQVMSDYQGGAISILTEADLQGHLFRRLAERLTGRPLPLHACRSIHTPREKPDLVIGEKEIAIELKVEADYPGVSKPVVFPEDVWKDLHRLHRYCAERIVSRGYFLMLDEDGSHARRPETRGMWRDVHRGGKRSNWLFLEF